MKNETVKHVFPSKEAIIYVRDANGIPNGCLLARKVSDSVVHVGWSAFNEPKIYPFIKERAKEIARERVMKNTDNRMPDRFAYEIDDFIDRCKRYFKVETVKVMGLPIREKAYQNK